MKFSRLVFATAILALAGYAVFYSVAADQPQAIAAAAHAPEPVPTGTYQPFNMMQKLRFSATTLVNPKVAEGAAVVYSFEADDVLVGDAIPEITSKLASGSVRFGQTIAAGGLALVRVDDRMAKELADLLKSQPTSAKSYYNGKWKFLATSANLAGVPASGEWIAWEPELKK